MLNQDILVSIIMPCFNAGKYIGDAIRSVLRQTHSNWELIVINDGSTDNSEEIIRSFKDPRIKYRFQVNNGQSAASNAGLRLASGSYIKFLDADDVINDNHLKAQLARLAGSVNAVASCAWGRFYNEDFRSAKFLPERVWKDMTSMQWIKVSLSQKNDMMAGWLWLIPREVIRETGGWDERLTLNNDFEFSMRLLMNVEKVLFTGEAKVFYRSGIAGALSQTFSKEKYEAAILSSLLGCQYLLDKENNAETRLLCANRFQNWLFQIYPDYPDLQEKLMSRINSLGGSNSKMDGGKVFRSLDNLIGWRAAKLIKLRLYRLGYRKLPFN